MNNISISGIPISPFSGIFESSQNRNKKYDSNQPLGRALNSQIGNFDNTRDRRYPFEHDMH